MKNKKPNLFSTRTLSNIITICAGVLLFLLLSNFATVRSSIAWFFSILSPFVVGIGIAYLLNMPMRFLEAKVFRGFKHKRALSIVATYLLAIFVLAVLVSMVFPQIIESIRTLVGNFTLYVYNLSNIAISLGDRFGINSDNIQMLIGSYQDLAAQVMDFIRGLIPNILGFTVQLGSSVVSVFTSIIASIYMLAGKEKLLQQCRRVLFALLPRRWAEGAVRVGKLSNGVFSGFIGGKLLDSLIIGIICFVGMSAMSIISSVTGIASINMPFAALISVIIGVTNVIPFFGPFIGAIPSAMILLMVNPWSALWFVVFIIVLQQFDGNILGPRILGESTGLPAIWVLVAIIVGGGLFGFTGMLLGVPTTAVLYSLASDFIAHRLKGKGLDNEPGVGTASADGTSAAVAAPPADAAMAEAECGSSEDGEGQPPREDAP